MKKILPFALLTAAALIAPAIAPAATISWNVANGDLGASANWNPITDISATGHTWTIANGGTANVEAGKSYTLNSVLNVGDTAGGGNLMLSGNGSLSVSVGNISIGQSVGGTGTIILNGTSQLTAGSSLYVGHRAAGSLTVNAGTEVDIGAALILGDASTSASGTLNLFGTIKLNGATGNVRLGVPSGSFTTTRAVINTYAGSFLSATGELRTYGGTGTFAINLNGSGSTFSFAKAITIGNASTTFSFIADAGGVTTATSSLGVDITDAALALNIDAYTGSEDLVLFSGSSITGTFASIDWLGANEGTVIYGANSIYISAIPEPSAAAYTGVSLLTLAMILFRRGRRHSRQAAV